MTRLVARRGFVASLGAAAAAAACQSVVPCGQRDPRRWVTWTDTQRAAQQAIDEGGLTDWRVEGPPPQLELFRAMMKRYTFHPRVLVDVSHVDIATTILGHRLAAPLLIPSSARDAPWARFAHALGPGTVAAGGTLLLPARRDAARRARGIAPVHFAPLPRRGPPRRDVLVSGIRSVGDASRAVDRGAHGIVIAFPALNEVLEPGPLELLRPIRSAVPADVSIAVAGAFRSGEDVMTALALGADAVVTGWPVLWGAMASGSEGVQAIVQMLQTELARAMALCGRRDIPSLRNGSVRAHAPDPPRA